MPMGEESPDRRRDVRGNYGGKCWICGLRQVFVRDEAALRESYRCARCEGSLREREQAGAILRCYAYLRCGTLSELVNVREFRRLSVYEPGTIGPFRPQFRRLPSYQQSDYYPPSRRSDAEPAVPLIRTWRRSLFRMNRSTWW